MAGKRNKKAFHVTYPLFCCVMVALIVLVNLLAWCSTSFCDGFVRFVMPVLLNTWGRLWGLFPFAVGDIFLMVTVLWMLVLFAMGIMCLFFSGRFREITKKVLRIFFAYVLVVLLVLTTNWWLLYHTTSMNERLFPEGSAYTADQLVALYNQLVLEANELADVVPRDEDGNPCSDENIAAEAVRQMQDLAREFSLLSGFYPQPKTMGLSAFFSQQYISGYYFPVTLEANINGLMMEINDPFVTCHELAHLKGYIREDEANCIGILACLSSDNAFFRYSGLLTALDYLEGAIRENPVCEDYEIAYRDLETYYDDVFLSQEAWAQVEDQAVVSTDVVSAVSDVLVDTSLKMNGVADGKISYNRVVELLLYYASEFAVQ